MNYDHHFHAGNFADVAKHITLMRIMSYLQKKPSPFRVIDTHAGSGLYDLGDEKAERSPEYVEGIAALMAADLPDEATKLIAPYLDAIRETNTSEKLTSYPGSPKLARDLLRDKDRLTAIELHPEAFADLKSLFQGDIAVKTMNLNGYQALPAQLPPKEKRGVILMDPPFEEHHEFDRMVATLVKAHRHFAHGIFALWYPLKNEDDIAHFKRQLQATKIPGILCSELHLRAPSYPARLFGTGMIVVNPPYVLRNELDVIFKAILPALSSAKSASYTNSWITPAP
ncbi:23S rRNA (adenine(2030)-N(6))-methyltransferase RlmJ [bacterium]|nr:23S rRNA (adenine(2030)-N(6))-methyltransferase RlmJ [bacterium]